MADLKTDYKDDVLDTSQNINRTFTIKDSSGNILYQDCQIEETTVFETEGDEMNAQVINNTNTEVNQLNNDLTANTFGTKDSLILNTEYVAPTDGYLRVYAGYANSNYVTCEINNDNSMTIQLGGNGIIGFATICFLRKGMTAKLTNCSGKYGATFSPLK